MEGVAAAAKKACAVAERILPGRPHHLTLNPHRKYAPPSGFWFTGTSSRLQYLTNLSDVDRGMLLTVPFFEIIDEPEPAKPVRTSKSGEPKKKMSFKDYKAGKKSASPTENNSPAKPDAKQGPVADARTSNEKEKVEETKPKETNGQTVAKPDKARPELNGERYATDPYAEILWLEVCRNPELTLSTTQSRIAVQGQRQELANTRQSKTTPRS